MKRFCLVILVLMLCLCLPVQAAEMPVLCFDGSSKQFTLHHTQGSDLFSELKNLIPGDTAEQSIRLRGKNIRQETEFYLKRNPAASPELLEQVTLSLYLDGNEITSGVPAGIPREGVLLFTLTAADEKQLKVVLSIPTEVGNEVAELQTKLPWIFTVQEKGGNEIESQTEVPKTGDDTGWQLMGFLGLAALSLAAAVSIQRKMQKDRQQEGSW